jgi:predicted phage gp36 major capsid-like protein
VKSAYRLVDRQRMTLQHLRQRYAADGQVGLLLRLALGATLFDPGP